MQGVDWESSQIVAKRLDTGRERALLKGGADARYVPGYLIYLQSGVLMAVPFDAARAQLTGSPVAMIDGVMQSINMPRGSVESGMGQFAVPASDNLVYTAGGVAPLSARALVRVDQQGVETELNAPKDKKYADLRVSPDGSGRKRFQPDAHLRFERTTARELYDYSNLHADSNRATERLDHHYRQRRREPEPTGDPVNWQGIGLRTNASLSTSSLIFATQLMGTTSPAQSVTLSDYGTATLTISSINLTGADPSDIEHTNTCGGSVGGPGGNCTISVAFKPTQTGSRMVGLTITDSH